MQTLDRSALERLGELVGGDPADLEALVESFLEEGEELVDAMRGALAGEDRAALHRAAHSLKANARDVGAERLAVPAAALENAAHERWPETAGALVGEIGERFDEARNALGRWLAERRGADDS